MNFNFLYIIRQLGEELTISEEIQPNLARSIRISLSDADLISQQSDKRR
jgi:hypothetical protein